MAKCKLCFQDVQEGVSFFQYWKREDVICGHCRNEFTKVKKGIVIDGLYIHSLYEYNDRMEAILFSFKESRDVALKDIFLPFQQLRLQWKFRSFTCVFVPSSPKKNQERAFFALDLLFERLKLKKMQLFEKTTNVKQSKQSMEERKKIKNYISLKEGSVLPQTNLLLLDDMCTSGSSLLACYELLKDHPYKVQALTLCIHKKLLI